MTDEPTPDPAFTAPIPTVRPLGYEVTAEMVQEVWDAYIKPGQDAGMPQSVEERVLMAILRSVYAGLTPSTEDHQ